MILPDSRFRGNDEKFVAHCLELDIVTTGDTVDRVRKDIVDLICAQVDYAFTNDNLENLYRPAPKEVWEEYFACKDRIKERLKLDRTIPGGEGTHTFVPPWIIANTCQKPTFYNDQADLFQNKRG